MSNDTRDISMFEATDDWSERWDNDTEWVEYTHYNKECFQFLDVAHRPGFGELDCHELKLEYARVSAEIAESYDDEREAFCDCWDYPSYDWIDQWVNYYAGYDPWDYTLPCDFEGISQNNWWLRMAEQNGWKSYSIYREDVREAQRLVDEMLAQERKDV